ncbi:MAG: TatD family hydrolase [Alistipes sp.]|nr:TatD family hydrolase [Alistipes sp.]
MGIPYINIHTHTRTPDALCVVSYGLGRGAIPAMPGNPYSAGIHPWDAGSTDDGKLAGFLEYLETADIAAVGEAGLDKVKGGDMERQQEVFRKQIEIAARRKLPVIVHCVKAYNELFGIVRDYPGTPFILHGYTGSPEQTARALDCGCYISAGLRSVRSPKTVQALQTVPADRIFTETDEADIPVRIVYERLAEIKNVQINELSDIINDNFNRLFR